jgi:hypothetical protein
VSSKQLTPKIPALGNLRQEDGEIEASLDYIVRETLSQKTKGT